MLKIIKKISYILFCSIFLFVTVGCSTPLREGKIEYSFKDISNNEISDKLYVGNSYYFYVNYKVGDENSDNYSFISYINLNDNIVVTYIDGPSFLIKGNFIEVNYSGDVGKSFHSTYKIDVKSAGISYIKLKEINNVSFETTEIKINVKEKIL